MITTVGLANIHHHTYLQIFFFLVMGTFKIYSLSNCKICNTVLLSIVATQSSFLNIDFYTFAKISVTMKTEQVIIWLVYRYGKTSCR